MIAVRLNLRDLAPGERLRAPFDERITLQLDGQTAEAEARGEVEVFRTGQGVVLQGRVEADVPLVCSRCLLSFHETVRVRLDEEFSLRPPELANGELGPQDFISWIGPEQQLDVREVVRQHMQMAIPMAPVHRADCRGLCPVCGANWNERSCEHQLQLEARQSRRE